MSGARYVVVSLTRTRQAWCTEVARWATSGAAPVELVTCMSADEVLAVLGSGRRISALLADAGAPRLDRELIHATAIAGAPTIVVTDGRVQRDWESLGCAAVIGAQFDLDRLLEVLEDRCELVHDDLRVAARVRIDEAPTGRATTIAVTGPGGTGSSTIAMCIAQSLGDGTTRGVALVDGVRRGDLAMYHDVGDVIPGLPELVDAHRVDTVDPEEIRRLFFRITERSYDVLLGLRRPQDWVSLRPRSVGAALDGLRVAYDAIVVDVDADLEGESATGSIDVEDRHSVTRTATARADLVVVVGTPGLKGLHDLLRLTDELALSGVPAERILPVLNRSTRTPTTRAATTSALGRLAGGPAGPASLPALHLPTCRRLEQAHRQVGRLPERLCRPLGRSVRQVLLDSGPRAAAEAADAAISPGDLGVRSSDRPLGHSEVA